MSRSNSNAFIWVVLALGLVAFLRHNNVGRTAPDFALQGAYGGQYHLDTFRGRPLLLVFWTTSCPICRHELPILDGLSAEAARNGVEVACVNIGDMDGAREFMRPLHLLNLVDPDGSAARDYQVTGVPKLVLIGADGKIRRSASGFQGERTLHWWMQAPS
jgi:cytochrome c biogenesis protein CcmG, thiol:disulfide interchange protein DsbE